MHQNKWKILGLLFWHNFILSAFTFGGGYVIVSLMQKEYVDKLHWIDEEEMLDMVSMAQSAPGALAVNASIMVGWKLAGWTGMLVSVAATCLPCMLILSVISFFYTWFVQNRIIAWLLKGMQAGVAALIVNVAVGMSWKTVKNGNPVQMIILGLSFAASAVFNVNVVWIILGAILTGIFQIVRDRYAR